MRGFLLAILILSINAHWGCQSGSQAATQVLPKASAPAALQESEPSGRQDAQLKPAAREFDGVRAYQHLVKQCSFGPRIPGMPGHANTRDYIVNHLKANGFTVELQKFNKYSVILKKTLAFENIIARLDTSSTKTVVLSCHWDTRPIAEQDPLLSNRQTPILGANDAGSGVAVLLELATAFKKHPPPTDLIFLFFDAEDYGDVGRDDQWCMGSQHLADNPPDNFEFVVGVNLDMVADKDQLFLIEPNSLITARKWTEQLWTVGMSLYPRHFSFTQMGPMIDDHMPFVNKGLPYLDIIDFEYPAWHTLGDTPDKCAPESLSRIGKTVAQWLFMHF